MSQIFEALRRNREQHRVRDTANRTARADAVLATLGFPSEQRRNPSDSLKPLLLVLLLTIGILLGWRWYIAGTENQSIGRFVPSEASAPPAPPGPRAAAPSRGHSPSVSPPQPGVRRSPNATRLESLSATSRHAPPLSSAAQRRSLTQPIPKTPADRATLRELRNPGSTGSRVDSGYSEAFQLAVYYHRSGDFENALTHYRAVLQQNELNVQAHNNLGLLYREKGLLEDAVREFQRALLIDGRYLTARNNLGVALLGQGRSEEAAAEFQRVLQHDPRNVDAMVNLALTEKSAGQPEMAIETLIRAIAMDARSAPAHYNLAVLYEQAGELSRAVEHYRAFLANAGSEHTGRSPEVRLRLAELTRRASRH